MKFRALAADKWIVTPAKPATTRCRDHAMASLDRLPPFSLILNRLLATMAKDDVSFANLAELIEKDTVLAGNVLRLVNSALYSFQGTVNSVRHAVAILGLNKLRNVALSMSIARMWTQVRMPPGWSAARFNMHSVATGVLADLLSQQVDVPYPEGGFVAGLLHDIGKLLIAVSLPNEYAAIVELLRQGERTVTECELEVTGMSHAELSGAVLARWNLPGPIQKAAMFHHAPEEAFGGELHLSHLVRAADQLANDLGHSVLPRSGNPLVSSEHLEALGVGEQLPAMLQHFEAEFVELKRYF
ncbi:MAG: HDOD domain-containing protein [Bryobacteraceae bacterium]|jgi:HD-like signal output (HDOD) protein